MAVVAILPPLLLLVDILQAESASSETAANAAVLVYAIGKTPSVGTPAKIGGSWSGGGVKRLGRRQKRS